MLAVKAILKIDGKQFYFVSGDTVDALKSFFSEQCRKGPRSNDFFFPQLNLDTRTCTQKLYYPERKCGCYTCIG